MSGSVVQSALLARRERLGPVLLASAIVHAALVTAAVVERPGPQIDLSQKPIVAKLVRLGEKRPPNLLPRKEAEGAPPAPAAALPSPPAPATAPPRTATPAPKVVAPAPRPATPAPKHAAKSTPSATQPAVEETPGSGDVLASVISRVKREKALEEPVYGDPGGDPLGDAAEASAGDEYLASVERTLRETYILPATISERERLYLKATVVLYIDAEGQVIRYTFEQRSGNGAFDAALERAIRAARLPPPPAELRQRYRSEGLGVVYRP